MIGGPERIVLLAAPHLSDGAYAVTIRRELEARTGRKVFRGALYTVLERLESKGLLTSRMGDPTPERGGRPKRCYRATPAGVAALSGYTKALQKLWGGLESVLGVLS
jgi:DNA-binding PadR family transcriptional regulator